MRLIRRLGSVAWSGALVALAVAFLALGCAPKPPEAVAGRRCAPVPAGDADDGLPIAGVSVEGRRHVSEADVLSYMRSRPGRRYTKAHLDDDVVALFHSGRFSGVATDPVCTNAEISIRVVVRETPLIKAVRVGDSACTSARGRETLAGLLASTPGFAMEFAVIAGDVAKLRDACRSAGRPVDARPVLTLLETNEVLLAFELTDR